MPTQGWTLWRWCSIHESRFHFKEVYFWSKIFWFFSEKNCTQDNCCKTYQAYQASAMGSLWDFFLGISCNVLHVVGGISGKFWDFFFLLRPKPPRAIGNSCVRGRIKPSKRVLMLKKCCKNFLTTAKCNVRIFNCCQFPISNQSIYSSPNDILAQCSLMLCQRFGARTCHHGCCRLRAVVA